MPYDTSPIEVQSSSGTVIRNHLYHHTPPADKLMIILPGRGYTVEHPALFHLRYLALENGYDVLPVQYGFQVSGADFEPAHMPQLVDDVRQAALPTLERGYRQVCIAGKSLGTPLAIDLAQSIRVERLSLILLTPIGPALMGLKGTRTLAVIGTADSLYSPETIRLTADNAHLRWVVLDDLDHGFMKRDDWRASVAGLASVLDHCQQFLEEDTQS